jgi:hypothetical protein
MNSKLYDAQDELKTLLDAAAGLNGVTKALGTPLKLSDLQEVVWVSGEVEDWNADFRVTALQAKDETFVLRVHCLVTRTGDYKAARDRAKTFAQAVEDTIRNNYTLNGAVELAQVKSVALEEARLDERRHQVLITIYVACRAWLA